MHILHLTTFLQGGAGLAIAQLACAQKASGHDVAVVSSQTGAPGYGNYPAHVERLEKAGVPVHLVDSLFDRGADAHQRVRALLSDTRVIHAPDLVHTHAAVPSRIALLMRTRGWTAPVIQTMHGWGVSKTKEQGDADVEAMNCVARVVAPSRAAADHLVRLGVDRAKLTVIPYGVEGSSADRSDDLPSTDAAWLREQRRSGRQTICCVGTIGFRKNQELLVDALALLPKARRPLCLFVGDGPSDRLQARAVDAGLAADVRCLGYRADARALARAADWLVLPSRSEGLPLTLIEAFADGVPVMASDIPELAEMIDEQQNGLLFRSESAPALAACLASALAMSADARRRLASAARDRFLSTYQLDAMVTSYFDEYAALSSSARQQTGSSCAA